MRYQFLLVPAALIATATPAAAMEFQSLAKAQAALFPGASFTPQDIHLTDAQIGRLGSEVGTKPLHPDIKAWQTSTGGWLFVDQVIGLLDQITYAVGIDKAGRVIGVEILVCAEGFCDDSSPQWRSQFADKRYVSGDDLSSHVKIISGQTLASSHVTYGVERIMAIHALFVAPGAK